MEMILDGKKYKLIEISNKPIIELTEFIDGIQRQCVSFKSVDEMQKFFKRKNPLALSHFEGIDEIDIRLRWVKR